MTQEKSGASLNAAATTTPSCPYCGSAAKLVGVNVIYPHRPDLAGKYVWQCTPCDAHVGCHQKGAPVLDAQGVRHISDGTLPLGRLANKELRAARLKAHAALDPSWNQRKDRSVARLEAYAWLAAQLELPTHECHIGMFDVETCERAVQACAKRKLLGSDAGPA